MTWTPLPVLAFVASAVVYKVLCHNDLPDIDGFPSIQVSSELVHKISTFPSSEGDVDSLIDFFKSELHKHAPGAVIEVCLVNVPESSYNCKTPTPRNLEKFTYFDLHFGKTSVGYVAISSNVPLGYIKFQKVIHTFNNILHSTLTTMRSNLALRRALAVNSLMKFRANDAPVDKLLQTALDCIDQLIHPELVSIYLCDQTRREIFICASKDGIEGLTMSFDQGIAGYVASTGQSILIEDAYKDKRFLSSVDKLTGQKTKTIMCSPVPGFTNALPLALIQVINKVSGGNFTSVDEESLHLVANELYLGLRAQARDLYELKTYGSHKNRDLTHSRLEASLLQEYGSTIPRYKYIVIADKIVRSTSGHLHEEHEHHNIERHPSSMSIEVLDFDTNAFDVPDKKLISLSLQMFLYYRLFDELNLDILVMQRFLEAVYGLYHADNAFHNFKHAWSVMHSAFEILVKGADQVLNHLEIFTVLIAALCHDLDHPGHNNHFEIVTRSSLAILYSDDAVLERHHCAMTQKLLSKPDHDILHGLTPENRQLVRRMLTSTIMATDMAHHFDLVDKLVLRVSQQNSLTHGDAVIFDPDDSDAKRLLMGIVVHSADLSAQTMPLNLALVWTDCISREFASQNQLETQLGLEPTAFMCGLDDEVRRLNLQYGFIGNIVLPLWTALSDAFPELKGRVEIAVSNRTYYMQKVQELSGNARC